MNSRYLAVLSLAIMACGFLVTLLIPETTAVFLLRGGFEAGLVGGIADWFAVTALFRHPFGIPIPHTSLLLKNREKIVRSLISAMENELLNKQSIEDKLRKLNILRLSARLLAKLLRKRSVRQDLLDFITQQVRRLPIEKSLPFLQSGISDYIRSIDAKAAAETFVTKSLYAGYDEKAMDYVLTEALRWVERPDTRNLLGKLAVEKISEAKAGGLTGFAIQAFAGFMSEDKLGLMLQNLLVSAGRDLLDHQNQYRERFIREIRVQLFELAGSDERMGRLKEWAANHVQSPDGEQFLHARLEEIRTLVLDKLEKERSRGGRVIFAVYRTLVRSVNKEPEWIVSAENRLLNYLVELVETNHYRIGLLVKDNLDRMDDASLVDMLEQKIGEDLQWIRVNGAICGFIIGLVLSLIQLVNH
ncbi:MAG: hypothetical protein JWR03_2325 [Cohnella sp.]|nr:hypothetical protein [Cohnella sp.]